MTKIDSVLSADGAEIIDIIESQPGVYRLHRYEKKYDPEEQSKYIIRVLPDPDGLFGDLASATAEANRLVAL